MAGTILVALLAVRGARRPAPSAGRVLNGVVGAFLAMSVTGVALALAPGSLGATLAFGLVMGAAMTAEFLLLVRFGLRPDGSGSPTSLVVPKPSPTVAGGHRPPVPAEP
jgi:hypothetical protein